MDPGGTSSLNFRPGGKTTITRETIIRIPRCWKQTGRMCSIARAGEHLFLIEDFFFSFSKINSNPPMFLIFLEYLDYAKTMPKFSICAATVVASSGKRTAIHASSIINRQITNQMSPAATQKHFMCPSRLRRFSNFSLFKPRQFSLLHPIKG